MPPSSDDPQSNMLELIADVLGEELTRKRPLGLKPDMKASDVPGWDSLVHTRIILELEDRLGREIDIGRTYELATIGELADYLGHLVAARSGRD
jgi:acyl carrier protein